MTSRNYRDIVAGLLLIGLGGLGAWYAGAHYDLGSLGRMGPGMFPSAVCVLIALFGMTIAVPAFLRRGKPIDIRFAQLRAPLAVTAAICVFAMTVRSFGLIPSATVVVALSTLAGPRPSLRVVLLVSFVVAVLTWVIFGIALNSSIPLFSWPS